MPSAEIKHSGPADRAPRGNGSAAPQPSPSQQIINAASQVTYVTDSLGRSIGFRPLTALETSRIVQMLGAADAANSVYLTMIQPALEMVELEGQVFARPITRKSIEGRMVALGDEGHAAIMADILRRYAEAMGDDTGTDEDGEPKPQMSPGEALKNAPGTPD